jgi:multidrug resistance efflux pump
MRRIVLVPLLIVVAVLAIGGGVAYYFYQNYLFYRTDDAQVSGNIVAVSAPASGQLNTLSVKQGDRVTSGQTLATLTATSTTGAKSNVDITSPITGTILQVPTVQGQNVSPGLTLMQLTNTGSISVTAYVDESIIDSVKTGQDVDIHVDAFSNTTYSGKVQQIVQATAGSFSLLPTQDNASGNFTKVGQRIPVVITLDGNSGKDVVPGMSAEVTIHIH